MEDINKKLEDIQETVNSIHQNIVTARIKECEKKANRLKLAYAILSAVALGIMAILAFIGLTSLMGMVW